MNETKMGEKTYPGVEFAYPFAVESYELALNRFEAMDSRIETLLAVFVTATLAVPVLITAKGLSVASYWLWAATASFIASIVIGLCGRLIGSLKVVDPQQLYEKFLHLPKWEFQKDFIYWAGQNYQSNRVQVERKHRLAVLMTFSFILEVLFLGVWGAALHGYW